MLKSISLVSGFLVIGTVAQAADAPTLPSFRIETVRASDAIDPSSHLLNVSAIRTEVTPNRKVTGVEVSTFLIATVGSRATKIGSFYCHTGGPYGPRETHKSSAYAFVSCDRFPPNVYIPKGSRLTATVDVSTAEGVKLERRVRVRILPRLH